MHTFTQQVRAATFPLAPRPIISQLTALRLAGLTLCMGIPVIVLILAYFLLVVNPGTMTAKPSPILFWLSLMLIIKMLIPVCMVIGALRLDGGDGQKEDTEAGYPLDDLRK